MPKINNAADESDIARRANAQKRDKNTRETIVRTLMSHEEGRRYVWLFLSRCHIFEQVVDFGPGGFGKTCFNEGQRTIGLEMLADVTHLAPNEYLQMTLENARKEMENGGRSNND